MTQSARSDAREEVLRTWAGRLLAGIRDRRVPPVEDAELIRRFLSAHGVGPLMAADRENGSAVDWREPDEYPAKRAAAAEMARRTEFTRVVKALLAGNGSAPIIFKGQALAYNTYRHPWLRPRTDIDALVERSGFEAMVDALSVLGYERADAIDADLVLPQLSLRKRRHGVSHVWDVHWRVSNRPAFAEVLPYRDLREAAVETRVDDVAILTPDSVDSLLIACLHLVGHHAGEVRLIWLYDIHLLAASMSNSEYQRFVAKAMSPPPVRAACHAAMEVTQRYIPGERTDELRRTLDPGAGARWAMDRTYLAGLIDDASAVGKGDRLRFVTQHVFPTADYMVKRFGIRHRWQLPFWYVVRIGRAVPKLFRKR